MNRALKLSEGLRRGGPFAAALALYGISVTLLALSLKGLPVGVAYAIWSGVGTVLVVAIGILWLHESATPARLLFTAMIVCGAVGLNLTTGRS